MLTIGLATRRRPGLLARTVAETLKNIKRDDTKIIILVDDDDDGTLSMRDKLNDPRIIWSIEPRPDSLGEKYNRIMKIRPAEVYMTMVDYAPCVTKDFDEKIIEASEVYPDGYAIILNWLANLSFSQLNAITHKLAVKLGGIYPEHFPYWFVDHWLEDMARQIGRQVFVDVVMDCSKRPGTMDKMEPALWGQLFNFLYMERRELARAIVNAPDFDETPARKKALLRNEPLIRHWSEMINQLLRGDPGGTVDGSDERYMRIRKKATDIMERLQPVIQAELAA